MKYFKIFTFILSFILAVSCRSFDEKDSILLEIQSYEERPSFEDISAQKLSNPPAEWNNYKKAMVETLAMLYGVHKGSTIAFMARDGEFLYDLSREFQPTDGKTKTRLVNISRKNVTDPNIMNYLKDVGIGPQTFTNAANGKTPPIVFFDTGYDGTIFSHLKGVLPKGYVGQLVVSNNPTLPSSRTFWTHLVSDVRNVTPQQMHQPKIVPYEHLPRYTYRSTHYSKVGGKWVPVSDTQNNPSDPNVSKSNALRLMRDLKHFSQLEEVRELFERRQVTWGHVSDYIAAKDYTGLEKYCYELVNHAKGYDLNFVRALVMDISEFSKILWKNNTLHSHISKVSLSPTSTYKATSEFSKLKGTGIRDSSKVKKNLSSVKPGKTLKKGREYKVEGEQIKILDVRTESESSVTYKVRKSDGSKALLRVSKSAEGSDLKKLAKDAKKQKALKEIRGVRVADIILQGEGYILREYVEEGQTAAEWLKNWKKNGKPTDSKEFSGLSKLIRRTARNGVFVGSLNPENIKIVNSRWVLLSVEGVEKDLSSKDVKEKYRSEIKEGWGDFLSVSGKSANDACSKILDAIDL